VVSVDLLAATEFIFNLCWR